MTMKNPRTVLCFIAAGRRRRGRGGRRPPGKELSLALADEAAAAAVQCCRDKTWLVAAAVVDRAGQLKALQRADGAGPHTVEASRRKAYTAASARNATSAMVDSIQKNPAAANL